MSSENYYETTLDRQCRVRVPKVWVDGVWKVGQPLAIAPIYYRRKMALDRCWLRCIWHIGRLDQDYRDWAVGLDKLRQKADSGNVVARHLMETVYDRGITVGDSSDDWWRVKVPIEVHGLPEFPSRQKTVYVLRDDPDVSLWSPEAYSVRHKLLADTWMITDGESR